MHTSSRSKRPASAPHARRWASNDSGVDMVGSRPPILCLEDDDDLRAALCDLLADAGYLVYAARSVEEALGLLGEETSFSLILTDHSLPDGTGLTMLATARARGHLHQETPVVLLTADDPAHEYAVAAVFRKPLDAAPLLATIESLVDRE